MSFPDMSRECADWRNSAKFTRVGKTTADHEISEDLTDVQAFDGIFYQHSAQEIIWKAEGQRTWRWWHLLTSQNLILDDVVQKDNVKYRVMSKMDWSQMGYYEYEIAEAFLEV
jgi:hypothetical protein